MVHIPRKKAVASISLGALATGAIGVMTRHRFSQKLTNGDLQAVSDLYYALNRARSDDDLAGIVKLRNMARTMELKGHGSLKGLQKQIVYLSYQQLTDEQDAALETFMNVLHDRADQNGI